MSKTYVGIKLQDLGLYNTLDPKDKIVIVKDKDEGVLQLKDFFLYVQSNLDLSNYYTSTQADTIFMAKVDAYTRKDADAKFALVEKTYTRLQSDSRFALAADTFNKTEIEEKYASKEQMYTKDLVYTKDEAITAFALKTEIPILPDLTPYSTTAKGDLRWALKVDVFSKTEADARFANINNYYTKSETDNKYALLTNTYTKAETDNKFLDTTEAYNKDYINLNIYTKTQVYTKAETDSKYPLKTDVYTVTAVNDQFAAKSWVYSRADADNTFRKLADSYNRAEVNALIDASKSGLSTDVSNTYYTKTDADAKFELKGTAYNKIDSDAKYALISNSISPSQVASKYYNKTEIDKSLGDAATNTSNLFALKTAAVGGVSLTPTNLTFTKVDGTSSLVTVPTWNQSTTGNAATATQLQTGRNIGITGAVTAEGVSFNGSSNININATSLDASKLTNIVPNTSLNGTYTNVALDFTNKAIYSIGPDSLVAYGLASIRGTGTTNGNVMVIKTKLSFNSTNVINLNLKGVSDSETNTIDISISGYIPGNISKLSIGTKDYDIKKAKTPDGYLCFIMSHPSGVLGASTAFSIVSAHINLGANPANLVGWSIYETNDISTLTNISPPCPQSTSIVNTFWGNVQNKPTTVSGYGITDAYTKTDVYTKTETDGKYPVKVDSTKTITLTPTNMTLTKADNTVSNITIPTWNQSTTGNAATATTLQTARTINGVSFDGTTNITTPAYGHVYGVENRTIKPNSVPFNTLTAAFSTMGGMTTDTANGAYVDVLALNTWVDTGGGRVNALVFSKNTGQAIYHLTGAAGTNTWITNKQIAYTDSSITGNAATATRWQTARTFSITGDATWSASVDGSSNVTGSLTLANTGISPGTYTKVTVDSKGRATSASNLVPADIPNLDMSKVNTGVLGISQGGTGATTAVGARTNLGLGTSAVLNVGAVNGVASLDGSGKVPTSQLYINDTLTSTDTTVPLTAAQGKVLNDRIGTTNTNLQTLTNRLDTNYYLKSDVFTKTEITTNYFDKTYVNNNFLAQAANKDVSIAGFINAAKDLLFTTSLTGIKWNMNTDIASIYFKNTSDTDTDSYLGFDVGDTGDEYFRWSFTASSNNKVGMSLRRDKLEINNAVATLGLSTSASLTDISKIPQYGIYSKGNITTDGQIITNAPNHHTNISDLGLGNDSPIRVPEYTVPQGQTGYIPFIHGSIKTATSGYTTQSSIGLYRANDTWNAGGMYMAIGGNDRYPTAAFRFKLDGSIDFTGGNIDLVGNSSSATKLQTARTIGISGGVTATATAFDGSANISIPVTSVDATKLTGTIPNNNLSGIYSGFTHVLDGTNTIYTTYSPGRTVYGLAECRYDSGTTGAIVFMTNVAASLNVMKSIRIRGYNYTVGVIDMIVDGYAFSNGGVATAAGKISVGSINFPVRFGRTADNKLAIILGEVDTVWSYPHISITEALFSHTITNDMCYGWTSKVVTDFTEFTILSAPVSDVVSDIKTNWNNVASTPTTLSGYGITDTYTRAELDARYSSRKGGIKAITLSATNLTYTNENDIATNVAVPTWNQSTTGNAATAGKWLNARTITLNGDLTGTVSLDGSSNVELTATIKDDSHNHVISNIDGLQSTLDKISTNNSYQLPATPGWYRVAVSTVGVSVNAGRFDMSWSGNARHGVLSLTATAMFNSGNSVTLNQLMYSPWNSNKITSARIVYPQSYTGNYAYLEIYWPTAYETTLNVSLLNGLGWNLLSSLVESSTIPEGHYSKEITFNPGFVTNRQISTTVENGIAPFTVVSTTMVDNLNADLLDGYNASTTALANTIPVRGTDGILAGNISGNAATATILQTARNIALTGPITGTASFNGSANIAINTAIAASPALTGTPTAPTPIDGTNTTQIATTAFVQNTVGGYLSKSVTGGTVALTEAEASNATLYFAGTLTSNLIITVPVTNKRLWAVWNNTSGAFTLTIKTPSGTGVLVAQGKRNLVYSDGTNVQDAFNDFESIALTGVPTAPTAAVGNNTTQIATTAFVNAEIANDAPTKTGTGASGTWPIAVSGNSATATKLATARSIAISGAAIGTATNFDGSENISIPVTSLDATKLSGTVPNANINGTYSGFTHILGADNTVFTAYTAGRTVYGLAEFRGGSGTTGAIVFITNFSPSINIMKSIRIRGYLFTTGVVDMIIDGYSWSNDGNVNKSGKICIGTLDFPVRFGQTTDGKLAIILGDVNTLWSYPHISITEALFSQSITDQICTGWTSKLSTDLSEFTNLSAPISDTASRVKPLWTNILNTPTTVAGYGITDTYTKTESDGKYALLGTAATESVISTDKRKILPSNISAGTVSMYFTSKGGLETATANNVYGDFIALNTYNDNTVGSINGLFFQKSTQAIYHYFAPFGSTSAFPTPKQIAYTDSNITGNAATATTLQTARTINGVSFNGSANITVADATKLPTAGGTITGNLTVNGTATAGVSNSTNFGISSTSGTAGNGISLYGGAVTAAGVLPTYGFSFSAPGTFGTHGSVTATDWAVYLTCAGSSDRGWIFKNASSGTAGNVASISNAGNAQFNGSVYAGGDVTAFSDKRLKENITPIVNALSKVKELNGVTYTRNDLDDKELGHIGLIAQDVQAVFPEAVRENSDGYLTLNYMGLVGSLVEAIKELDTKNQTLEARLAKLEELLK